jgi:signal-transduction protein with cAMP-binding, CBS, and nucleotidyltransferase domain
MERMKNFFNKYHELSDASKTYLKEHGKLAFYKKGTYYKIAGIPIRNWSFIIDGVVAKEVQQTDSSVRIERISGKNEYFTGTNHPYSDTPTAVAIKFLQPTILYEISNTDFKNSLALYPELDAIFHILKQHKINKLQQIVHILNLPSIHRIHELFVCMPHIMSLLTIKERCSFLNISCNRDYYKSLRYHIRQK